MSEILTAGEWVRNHVIELATIDPDASLDDLEPLREVIGDARVVALGEGAHFIEEFWTVRRRLTRFLCEHLGFRIVAAEFDLREGDDLQEWLANPADPRPLAEVSRAAADWGWPRQHIGCARGMRRLSSPFALWGSTLRMVGKP